MTMQNQFQYSVPPRNLADELTLFKPWGADYARYTTASPPPRIHNAIYTSGRYVSAYCSFPCAKEIFFVKTQLLRNLNLKKSGTVSTLITGQV